MQPHGSLSGGLASAQRRGTTAQPAPVAHCSMQGANMPPPPRGAARHDARFQQQSHMQRAAHAADGSLYGSALQHAPGYAPPHAPSAPQHPFNAHAHAAPVHSAAVPAPRQYMQPLAGTAQQPVPRVPVLQPQLQPQQPPWYGEAGWQPAASIAAAAPHTLQRHAPAVPHMPYVQPHSPVHQLQTQSYRPDPAVPAMPPLSTAETGMPPSSGTGPSHQTHDTSMLSGAAHAHAPAKAEPQAQAAGDEHLVVKSASVEESPPATERERQGAAGHAEGPVAQQGPDSMAHMEEGEEAAEGEANEAMLEVCAVARCGHEGCCRLQHGCATCSACRCASGLPAACVPPAMWPIDAACCAALTELVVHAVSERAGHELCMAAPSWMACRRSRQRKGEKRSRSQSHAAAAKCPPARSHCSASRTTERLRRGTVRSARHRHAASPPCLIRPASLSNTPATFVRSRGVAVGVGVCGTVTCAGTLLFLLECCVWAFVCAHSPLRCTAMRQSRAWTRRAAAACCAL